MEAAPPRGPPGGPPPTTTTPPGNSDAASVRVGVDLHLKDGRQGRELVEREDAVDAVEDLCYNLAADAASFAGPVSNTTTTTGVAAGPPRGQPGWIARCLAAGLDPKTATKWQVEDELKDFEDLTPQGKKNRELSPSARKELNKKQQERYHEKKDPLWGVNPGARKGGRIRVPKKKPNV